MADTDNVVANIESLGEMVNQIGKSLVELESNRDLLSHNKTLLEDIKHHFDSIQQSFQKSFDELEAKEKAIEVKKEEYCTLLAEREAAVAAREQDLLDRIQKLKDAAFSTIVESRNKYKVAPLMLETKLMQLCEQMDAKGLLKYVSDKRKSLANMSNEFTFALKCANEPAHLVLDTLEGFYPKGQYNFKDSKIQIMRRSCLFLLESAAPLWRMTEPGDDHSLSAEIKQRAEEVADEWKPKLAGMDLDASNGFSLEAQAFLQLLATFSISSEFDEDELCKLVVSMSRRRRQAPELCHALGLAHKMQDVVHDLINIGRLIDAVHFAHTFQLTDIFPPVPLLKQYLEDSLSKGKENIDVIEDADAEKDPELAALNTVLKCIEEYNLQEAYPPDALQNRISDIERAWDADKRATNAAQTLRKKAQANEEYTPLRAPVAVENRYQAPLVYYGNGDGYPDRYTYAAPSAYEVSGHLPYVDQANVPIQFPLPDERASLAYSSSANYESYTSSSIQAAPDNYGNYTSSELQSASSNYANYIESSARSSHQSYL